MKVIKVQNKAKIINHKMFEKLNIKFKTELNFTIYIILHMMWSTNA